MADATQSPHREGESPAETGRTEVQTTTAGWAPEMGELPGENYAKNPEGEQTRSYARVVVNGTFNEHLDGLDTVLEDDDRVALIYPCIYCC